jgi:hypothetical protein
VVVVVVVLATPTPPPQVAAYTGSTIGVLRDHR